MLERIPQRLSQVTSRQAGLALWLWGEAGVGKTYALERLLGGVGCRTLRLSAHLDLGRLLLALPAHADPPSWLEHTLARLGRGEGLEPSSLLHALCASLEGLAPVVLGVEDLPQAPPEVLEGWSALARRVARLRGVALLGTGRTAPPPGWEEARLEALSEPQGRGLLESQVGAELPPEAQRWVYARAQGNPALTLELFRFLVQGGSLYSDGARWHWREPPEGRVPVGVEALLLERVRPLRADPALEAALLAHALLPEAPERAQALSGLEPAAWTGARGRLEREGLLREGCLTLPMLAEVLHAALAPAERQRWARERVRVLCAEPPEYLAAVKRLDEAWLEPDAQLEVLRGAALQAEARGHGRRAVELWTEVLRWVAPEERLSLTRKLAWLLREVQPQEALRHIARVTALLPDDAEALLLEAEVLALSGRPQEAERRIRPEWQVRWREVLLGVRYRLDDMAGVVALYRAHPELVQGGVAARVRLGYALARQGHGEEALALYQDALERTASPGALGQPAPNALEQAWLLSAFATLEAERGDLGRAVRHFGSALEQIAGLDSPEAEEQRVKVLHNRAQALYLLRRIPEAMLDLQAALERLERAGDAQGVADAQVNLGLYHLMEADARKADSLLREARATLERSENPQSLLRLETALLQLHLEEAGGAAARAVPLHLRRALELLPRVAPLEQAQSLYFVGWAEALYGDPEAAEQHAARLEGLCALHGLEGLKPAVWAVRGHASERRGERGAALEHFQAACEGYTALGQGDFADRFGLEQDRLRGDPVSAALRLERLNAAGWRGWVEVGYRAFPQLRGASAPSAQGPAPATEQTQTPRLEVLGRLRLMQGQRPLTLPAEQGRRLLVLLLEARALGREGVRVLDLLEALYPDHDEHRAENALKQLVYRLRGSLGKGAVLRLGDRYALGAVSSDAEDFLRGAPVTLWRGPALEDFLEDEASTLRDLLHDRLSAGMAMVVQRDPTAAERLFELLLTARPYDGDLLEQAEALLGSGGASRLERLVLEGKRERG